MESYYPLCPDCNHEMRKIMEFSHSYEGTWYTYLFQCPECKRIDECGKGRFNDEPYFIIKNKN